MKLYPLPYEFNETDEYFNFTGKLSMKYNEEFPNSKTIELLELYWGRFTAGKSSIRFEKDDTLPVHSLSVGGVLCEWKQGFEHSILVTTNGFGAAAESAVGLIHAMCSILQLIQPDKKDNHDMNKYHISCCRINDRPSLEFRCYHVSFMPGDIEGVRRTIRLCGLMKYSYLLIEFFGTIKLDCLRELAYTAGSYTKEEIRPLIEEARAFGMELVPMFNCLGHISCGNNSQGEHVVLNQAPEYQALMEPDGWTFCLSNPDTKTLLKEVRKELIALCGEGKYFHMGGDEAYSLGTCDECRKTPIYKLYADYINEVADEMRTIGRRVIIWGDTMLEFDRWRYHKDSFGHLYEASVGTNPEAYKALDMLDRDVIINDWQYNIWDEDVITSAYFQAKGFDVILASAKEVKNIDALCKAARKHGYMGLMQTVWTKEVSLRNIVRGASASWMENIDIFDKAARGEQNFIYQYMLMGHRAGNLAEKVYPRYSAKETGELCHAYNE